MTHPFTINEQFEDRTGMFTVLSLGDINMTIQYESGQTVERSIAIMTRVYRNLILEQRTTHRTAAQANSPEDYFMLIGWLTKNATFSAKVRESQQPNFEERYYCIAGTRPALHSKAHYYNAENDDRWGADLRINFPDTTLQFPSNINIRNEEHWTDLRYRDTRGKVINNSEWWWELVRIGFRLGADHNISAIKENIPSAYMEFFILGMEPLT
jgi:hypothetical protein